MSKTKKYEQPKIEYINYDVSDVLLASGGGSGGGGTGGGTGGGGGTKYPPDSGDYGWTEFY